MNAWTLPGRVAIAGVLLTVALLAGGMSLAADETPRIASLVAQLGSNEFTEREAASDELTRAGLTALTALEAATVHPDREVRYRSVRILVQIRELDLQRRLEAFLSGKEDASEYPLPGWSRFKKAYGDDSQSRTLFVEIQQAEPELMRLLEAEAKAAADLLGQRAFQQQQAIQTSGQPMTLGQIAALVFVAAEEDVTLPAQTMSMVLNYCQQQALREALNNSSKKEIPRKMVGAIIRKSDDWAATLAMNLAITYNLDEGLVPATKILNNHVNRVPHMSQYALMTVAKLGNLSHLPLVEKLLDDKSIVTRIKENNNVIYDVQVGDAAIAAGAILTKQDLKTYFTARPDQQWTDPQQVFFNPRLIGFQNDEERAVVHKKWAEYMAQRAKQDDSK